MKGGGIALLLLGAALLFGGAPLAAAAGRPGRGGPVGEDRPLTVHMKRRNLQVGFPPKRKVKEEWYASMIVNGVRERTINRNGPQGWDGRAQVLADAAAKGWTWTRIITAGQESSGIPVDVGGLVRFIPGIGGLFG